jgi:hypothetical protein
MICSSCKELGYYTDTFPKVPLLFDGPLKMTSQLRERVAFENDSSLDTNEGKSLGNPAHWNDGSFRSSMLTKLQGSFFASEETQAPLELRLYAAPIKVRRDIILNNEQKDAAKLSHRPTIITGPAGCGKSVVLTERVKNLVEDAGYPTTLNILVSTFNKELISFLGHWIQNLLSPKTTRRVGNRFYFKDSLKPNITLMHFDILPTQLGNVYQESNGKSLAYNDVLRSFATKAIQEVKVKNRITTNRFDKVLQPDYIIEEYHRIIYGLQYVTKEDFLTSERKGRPRLQVNGEMRRVLWDACMAYLSILETSEFDSITLRRHKLLRNLDSGKMKKKFSHIFIDEFQDCTQADYTIFDLLLENPNNLVLAGDIAQAVHIGNVADIPRIRTEEMRNRKTYRLSGSYRLPYRVSEAILKLSEIEEGNELAPCKAAPPGARPIIVYGNNPDELAKKIKDIYECYRIYDLSEITILEANRLLRKKLSDQGLIVETDTILRLKGMEKTCVLWCTETDIEHKGENREFVYTILTRTAGILIITLTPKTLKKYHFVFKLLREDRVILWDAETKNEFHRIRSLESLQEQAEVEDF